MIIKLKVYFSTIIKTVFLTQFKIMETKNKSALTTRAVIVGVIGLALITASSMYVAIKMGALPWPAVFVTVLSMTVLKRAKNSTLEEINCTHTLMSAGSMVAGGLAFTVPGLWIMNQANSISFVAVLVSSIVGALLGTLFTSIYRTQLIEKDNLPYPIGEAAYKTLMTEKEKKSSPWLFSSLGGSALFTFIRDFFQKIPSVVTIFKGSSLFPALSFYVSPMAFSIGAIIGPTLSLFWTLGMVFGYYILTPLGLKLNYFSSMESAQSFRSSLGLGIMIGTGFAVVIKAIYSAIKNRKNTTNEKKERDNKKLITSALVVVFSILLLTIFTELTLIESILTVLGAAVATYLSSMLTGQTGINPMEVFAILVLLAVHAICSTGLTAAFTLASCVAVACGLSGDVMNDFKSGSLVGTNPKDQVKAEAIGGIIGAIIATAVLFLMKKVFVLGSPEMPAPQAQAVASMAGGLDNPLAFYIGVAIGFVMFLFALPSSAFGLGVYLGPYITVSVALGALIVWIIKKIKGEKAEEKISLVSAGLLGGEGCAGVIIAFITIFIG